MTPDPRLERAEAALRRTADAELIARWKYRLAAGRAEKLAAAHMEADIGQRPTYGPLLRLLAARGRVIRLRDALRDARGEVVKARRIHAAICQGVLS